MTNQVRILATRHYPEAIEQRLAQDYNATLNPQDRYFNTKDLVRASSDMGGLLISARETFDAQCIIALPRSVGILGAYSAGTDHIDISAALQRGLIVTSTHGDLKEKCADLAMLLLLNAARRAFEGDQLILSGKWIGWTPTQLLGMRFQAKHLGILEMEEIDRTSAHRATAFRLSIHYYNRKRLPPKLEAGATCHANPDRMLGISDFLSPNCPATPKTVGFLNRPRISLLPDRSVVVNISRGELIGEAALSNALITEKLAASGLDVFQNEPNVRANPRECPNVFLLPHAGMCTVRYPNCNGYADFERI
ncbi:MAG: NAD(P)-dependent oxidoreductase [Alphaproteobacteria bacterium]|nr:D-glycerate dehydrogenase [Alphaproteobacteria bacterium]HIO00510.1 D-glycerate dehydrogenase [Alphaproteobacteria bacterium]